MSLWIPHSPFWDWQVDFGPPSLKYSSTLHAQFGVSKQVIIIDSCVAKTWFTFTNLQSVSLKVPRPKILYFVLCFVFEWPVPSYIFAHWSNIACLPAGRIRQAETSSGSWKCYIKLWELMLGFIVTITVYQASIPAKASSNSEGTAQYCHNFMIKWEIFTNCRAQYGASEKWGNVPCNW